MTTQPADIAAAIPPPPRSTADTGTERESVTPGWKLLSTRGLAVLGVGVPLLGLGLWWRYPSLVGVAAALLLAVVADALMVLWAPKLTIRRTVDPAVVERRGECWATLTVTGRRVGPARISLVDRAGRQEQRVAVDSDRVTYPVPTQRRGLIEIGPLVINRVGMFGLALATSSQGTIDLVRVLPRLIPIERLPAGRRRSAVGADESAEHGGTDLVGLHEYVPGDDLRRLHWATSARTGQLMVRDDADPATPHLTVVLDDVAIHYADHDRGAVDFEDAVEVAFGLCRVAADQRRPVHLVTISGAVDVATSERPGSAEVEIQRMYAALAEIQPTSAGDHEGRPGDRARGMRLARGLDAVAVISGSLAPLQDLLDVAGRGTSGTVLIVDPASGPTTSATGSVHILRGPHSIELAELWDRVWL